MGTLLKVVGALTLVLVVLLVLAYFFLRSKLRKLGAAIGEGLSGLSPEATLVARDFPAGDAEVGRRVEALEALEFERGGAFDVEEMPGVSLVCLVRPGQNIAAVVYRHPKAGTWCDIYCRYQSAGSLTVTNAPAGGELDTRPGHVKLFDAALDEAALVARFDQELADRARVELTADCFKAVFEKAYADDMEWRIERGGATLDEVQRVAANMDGEFSAEEIAAATQVMQEQAGPLLRKKVRQALAASMSGEQWELASRRGVIIHEGVEVADLDDVVYDAMEDAGLGEDKYAKVEEVIGRCQEQGSTAEQCLLEANAALPEGHRFKLEAELEDPPAKLYLLS